MTRRIIALGSLVVFLALPLAQGLVRAADGDPLKFEVFQDKDKEYRWRLKHGDDIVGTGGQGYKEKASVTKAIDGIKKGVENGKDKFEVYEDNAKAYRWRLKAANGQVVGAANKGYKDKADCEKVVETIKKGAPKAEVVEQK